MSWISYRPDYQSLGGHMDEAVSAILFHRARTMLVAIADAVKAAGADGISAVVVEDPAGRRAPILHVHATVPDDAGPGIEYMISGVPTRLDPLQPAA